MNISARKCPHCGLIEATYLADAVPYEGSILVCAECAELARMKEDGIIECISDSQLARMDPICLDQIILVRKKLLSQYNEILTRG
jgi:hypothetical protein